MVFETGLPTRYYLNRAEVHFEHLVATDTVTACPYKGRTSGYWSVRVADELHPDLAWAYDFPTAGARSDRRPGRLLQRAGRHHAWTASELERPVTHFFK